MAFSKLMSLLSLVVVRGLSPSQLRGTSIDTLARAAAAGSLRKDCGLPSGFSFAQGPGAGMNPEAIKPFVKVLKDGYYAVDCVKDYMFTHGDKFGDNRASYKFDQVSNVSIVHYANHVPKEERKEMSHEVCFHFCRTVPDMVFFGLTNGRECYCMPFYEQEAGDSSDCDAVCDGDNGQMCGGKTKSNIFAMHDCSNTASDLKKAMDELNGMLPAFQDVVAAASMATERMQTGSTALQLLFGKAGDTGAADLLQQAKAQAGALEEPLSHLQPLLRDVSELTTKAKEAATGDFTLVKNTKQAEEYIVSINSLAAKVKAGTELLLELMWATMQASNVEDNKGAAKQYYSAMYFVDKQYQENPSTCTGSISQEPLVLNVDGCARACDNDVHECVAFSHFDTGVVQTDQGLVKTGLCFLFGKLKTIRYYAGCEKQAGYREVKCYAKLSKFEGESIKPDGSGRCDNCLKEVQRADRCYE